MATVPAVIRAFTTFLGGGEQPTVTLEGRAFAALLGSVACRENTWLDNPSNPASIAGSVCTEFGMLFTPESFAACMHPASFGHTTRAKAANSDVSGLGSITHNEDAMVVAKSSITRKATIKSMSTLNKRLTSDFTYGSELSDDEDGIVAPSLPYQLSDGLDSRQVETGDGRG